MKFSRLLIRTKKESPRDAESDGLKFLIRGSFIHKIGAGIYSFLPLGYKVLENIAQIIREELGKIGVQEVLMNILQPANFWKETGRFLDVGEELWKIKNRENEDFVLQMTSEEVITDIARSNITSYKDLPCILNQIQTKIRDEERPKSGLLRLKEFVMQDAYSFDKDEKTLDQTHERFKKAYQNIFATCGINAIPVKADPGFMGGGESWEFMVPNPIGEDEIVLCKSCGYAAKVEEATTLLEAVNSVGQKLKEKEKIKTPQMTSVEEICEFLGVSPKEVLKTIIYNCDGKLIMVLIRGDLTISEKKLAKVLNCKNLKIATEDEMDKANLVSGFVSPLQQKNIKIVADYSVKLMTNFVTGANIRDYHFKNVNLKDFKVNIWADLIEVQDKSPCPKCGKPLKITPSIEVGHTFKLGTKYSKAMKAYYLDKEGRKKPLQMGCYGIGLDRLMGTCAEENYDEKGLIWPSELAPFNVIIIPLSEKSEVLKIAEKIEKELEKEKIECLLDDRDLSAGNKFADADLIGIPIRLVISERTLRKDSVEIKMRQAEEYEMVKISEIISKIQKLLNR